MEKVRRDPASLSRLVKDFDLEVVYKGLDYDTRMITIPDVNRPALQLVGFYDYFEPKRLQILGKAEFTFLKAMPLEQRRKVFEDLLRCEIPALIVARNMEIFPELMEIARKHGRTLLRTEKTTVELTSHIIDYLNRALAPQITRHGVLMNIYGQGVLMIGDSGIGKSETAIELLKRGHRLVADDAVEIRHIGTRLIGSAPELIRHYIELRGIGVVDIQQLFGMSAVREDQDINLVVNLEQWNDQVFYDRLGTNEEFTTILDMKIPAITIPIKPGRNLAIIVEVAAMNNRHKRMGYNAAQEFAKQLDAHFEQMMLSSQLDAADDYDEYESLNGDEED